jgi:hypothetical protein
VGRGGYEGRSTWTARGGGCGICGPPVVHLPCFGHLADFKAVYGAAAGVGLWHVDAPDLHLMYT